jgi:predicted Ser/Thr protein kinase
MPWPTLNDYNLAVQNPRLNFSDPELQCGGPELTRLGLPRARSGNFGSVYRFYCGKNEWAVKCFTSRVQDQHERYAAIDEHLRRVKSQYTTEFQFIQNGIRVGGRWYPVLKMQWIQGESLNRYIDRQLRNAPTKLLELAREWELLICSLDRDSIAHGDLQHGNILVIDHQIKLIDYDGMYVPKLNGKLSHELENPHYQHPGRCERHFGSYLDNFSAWVIYVSLRALGRRPDIVQHLPISEEHLLLRKEDFAKPYSSKRLDVLMRQPEPGLQALATLFLRLSTVAVRA